MKTPSHIVHELAGSPVVEEAQEVEGECLICGAHAARMIPAKKGIPKTDRDISLFVAPWSDWVCEACVWTRRGKPPDTLRFWSMAYRADGHPEQTGRFSEYMAKSREKREAKGKPWECSVEALVGAGDVLELTNKADLTPITRLLCDPPDADYFVSLSDSGYIHTMHYAPICRGSAWSVRFERSTVESDATTFARVLWHVAELRLAGARDEEILEISPSTRTLMDLGLLFWITHAEPLRRLARSKLLEMALFVCTKETTHAHRDIALANVGRDYPSDADERGRRLAAGLSFQHPARQDRPQKVLAARAKGAAHRGGARSDLRADGERDSRPAHGRGHAVRQEDRQQDLFAW